MHIAEGTYRPDRHGGEDHSIDDIGGEPEKPANLTGQAGKMWDHLVSVLAPVGILTEIDAYQLEALSRQWELYHTLIVRAKEENYDDQQAARLERRAYAAFTIFDKLAGQFGLTPSARAKLRAITAEDSEEQTGNAFAEFGINAG